MSSLTDQPFGVNLQILFLQDDSIVDFVAECGVKFVTTSAGSPAKYIDRLKSAGLIVYHAVPSLIGALKAQEAGVDGLVVEGTEGGGFKNPEEIGLHVLIQAIRKKNRITYYCCWRYCRWYRNGSSICLWSRRYSDGN